MSGASTVHIKGKRDEMPGMQFQELGQVRLALVQHQVRLTQETAAIYMQGLWQDYSPSEGRITHAPCMDSTY